MHCAVAWAMLTICPAGAPARSSLGVSVATLDTVTVSGSLAEGVLVARPPRGEAILAAVRDGGGAILSVDDEALTRAQHDLGRTGLFVEPTSALVAAGIERLLAAGAIDAGETVLAALTGSGLKASAPST